LNIRLAQANDEPGLIQLIAEFRLSLAQLRGQDHPLDLAAARQELAEYMGKDFPIYVAESASATFRGAASLVGYLVCRLEGDVVWAESLYVAPAYRRQGVGSALYAEAERLAQELGGDTPYNWVDPHNDKIIHFLQQRGYNVLNLIELRRARPGEELAQKIGVGSYEFDTATDQIESTILPDAS
jgi:ribosomal protein S18 acetylase RimI-like enzyme